MCVKICDRYKVKYNEDTGAIISITEIYDADGNFINPKNVITPDGSVTNTEDDDFATILEDMKCCSPEPERNIDVEFKTYNVCVTYRGDRGLVTETAIRCDKFINDTTDYDGVDPTTVTTVVETVVNSISGDPIENIVSMTIGECRVSTSVHGAC